MPPLRGERRTARLARPAAPGGTRARCEAVQPPELPCSDRYTDPAGRREAPEEFPVANPVTTTSTAAQTKVAGPTPTSFHCACGKSARLRTGVSQNAQMRAAVPPIEANRTLSVKRPAEIRRERLTPSAMRVAISRWRCIVRTSRRFATLAPAISRMSNATPARRSDMRASVPWKPTFTAVRSDASVTLVVESVVHPVWRSAVAAASSAGRNG